MQLVATAQGWRRFRSYGRLAPLAVGIFVFGAAAIGGALWTIRPQLTFFVAAVLGTPGTLWAVFALPARPAAAEGAR